jgi:hypothetical protein
MLFASGIARSALALSKNLDGTPRKCIDKGIAGVFKKCAKHHVYNKTREFELEIQCDLATLFAKFCKSPPT